MRLREFQERKQLQEAFFLPVIGWGLTVGGIAWQAYDTYNDIQEYNNSEKTPEDLAKLKKAVGEDILYAVAGAGVGVVAGKAIQLGASPIKKIYNAYKSKKDKKLDDKTQAADDKAVEKADDVIDKTNKGEKVDDAPQPVQTKPEGSAKPEPVKPDAGTSAGSTVKPGDTVTSASGKQKVAGVDGKATTVDPSDKAGVAKIKKAADADKASAGTVKKTDKPDDVPTGTAGAGASKVAKKADDDVPTGTAGAATSKVVKKKDDLPGGKAGAAGSKAINKGKNKIPTKRAGAVGSKLIAPAAGALVGKQAQKDAEAADKAKADAGAGDGTGDGSGKDTGPVFYTGFRKGPPKRVVSLKDRPNV